MRITLTKIVATAANSPAFWVGVGASIISIGTSLVGVIGQALTTLLTLRNQLRTLQGGAAQDMAVAQGTSYSRASYKGIKGLIRDLLRSPGLNPIAAGILFAVSCGETALRGHFVETSAFAAFALGNLSLGYLANSTYRGERRENHWLERAWSSAWKILPLRLKNVLLNPAPWFSAGNLAMVLKNLDYGALSASALGTTLTVLAATAAGVSVLRGIWPLFSGKDGDKPSGTASYLAAATTGLLGVSSLFAGSTSVGIAMLCWTVTNSLVGRALNSRR